MKIRRRIAWLLGMGLLAILGTLAVKQVLMWRARRYLTDALTLIESRHVTRAQIDWGAVNAEAYRTPEDASTSAQTRDAIRKALARIGDHHWLDAEARRLKCEPLRARITFNGKAA